ncbi:MAG: GNAT family acetyltransferase [Lachnospiraceae bacterium]|nr:GNAT family acetyltransferase [Lachnospiraceae bacterium]
MKYLIMCEGPNEKKIIELLLEHDKMIINLDDLVGRQVFHARQIKTSPVVKTQMKIYGGEIEIWRVGDKQSDKLLIPNEFKTQIKCIKKYCTLPELEILLILSEKMHKEYEKTKSKVHPKQFAKENIVFNKKKYKGETKFYEEYYGEDIQKLVDVIREYKQRNHSHSVEQHYLLELLNDN